MQRYYYKREPRQLIPLLVPNESLNSIVLSENRSVAAWHLLLLGTLTARLLQQLWLSTSANCGAGQLLAAIATQRNGML